MLTDEDFLPHNPPSPTNTKQRGKRKKIKYKGSSTRNTSVASQIYRKGTDAIVADEATERRLGRLGKDIWVPKGYSFLS